MQNASQQQQPIRQNGEKAKQKVSRLGIFVLSAQSETIYLLVALVDEKNLYLNT